MTTAMMIPDTSERADGDVVYGGIDIGGTKTHVLVCTRDFDVIDSVTVPTPARAGGREIVRTAVDALTALGAARGRMPTLVCMGVAGVVDAGAGRVTAASDSFRGWSGYPVVDEVAAALHVPVVLDNDVNAFLRAEATLGAVRGESFALGIALGTGVGGALWLGGAIVGGAHGAAGEIGHLPGFGDAPCSCGQRGHLESLASGWAIAHRYAERSGRTVTARDVAAAATAGDRDAREVFAEAGAGVARAALITAGLVDVTTVVVGGGVSAAWPLLEPAVAAALHDEPPVSGRDVRVVPAALGGHAVALGAAVLAARRFRPAAV